MSAEVALSAADLLGEGPWWDDAAEELVRVDIKSHAVRRWSPGTGAQSELVLPDEVSMALPRAGGGLVVGQVDQICLVEPDGTLRELAAIEADNPETRLNDATCDDEGRLWVGTYSPRWQPDAGLHVVEPDGATHQVLHGLIASNGIAWHDGVLYAVDSGRAVVERFRLGPRSSLEPLGPLVRMDPDTELPDGLAVDVEGGVWVAVLKASEVRRYLPDGRLECAVPMPVTNPTSVAFGGPGLRTLFVTSSSYSLPAGHREPAGSVLALASGVAGRPVQRFAG